MTSDLLLQLRSLSKFIADSHTLKNHKLFRLDSNNIEISVDSGHLSTLEQYCTDNGFTFHEGLDAVSIDIQPIVQHIPVFIGIEEFQRYCRQNYNLKTITRLPNFFVVETDGSYLISENNALVESSTLDYIEIQYVLEYFRFASDMRGISNYVDEVTHTYILFTSNKGVVKIALGGMDLTKLVEHDLLQDIICRFEDEIKDARKLDFIKSAIIAHVEHSQERDIATILSRLGNILDDALRNHQLYIEEFSFEKFKTLWDKEKEKYFEKFRDVITKITAQMANLPIALIAFVITANDKLSNPKIELVFYSIFTVYVFATMYIQIFNLIELLGIYRKINDDTFKVAREYSQTHKLIVKDSKELKCKSMALSILSVVIIIAFAAVSTMVFMNCLRR